MVWGRNKNSGERPTGPDGPGNEGPYKNAAKEAQQRSAETAALLAATRAVLEFKNFTDAARSIFDSCKNLIGATSGYIALLSDDGSENEVLFLDAGGLPCTVDESLPMPVRGLRGEVYRTGKPAYDNDFMNSEWIKFMPDGHVRLENVLFAPLLIEGKVVGLLGIANKPGGFVDNDLKLASAFCDLVSSALFNDRTYEKLEKSEERFRSFVDQSSDGIVIIDQSGTIISWNHSQEKITGIVRDVALGQPLWDIQFSLAPSRTRVPEDRERLRVMISDFLENGNPFWTNKLIESEIQRTDGSRAFIQTITFPISTSSDFMAASITRDVTRRRTGEEMSDALNSINSAISTTMDSVEIMELVTAEGVKALECDSAAIFLREGDGWTLSAQYGLKDEITGQRFNDDEAPAMVMAATERRPVFVGDVRSDARIDDRSKERNLDVRSFLAVPLIARETVIGVITFNNHLEPSTFGGEQVDFANKLAASVSLAIDNARLYRQEQESRAKIQSHATQLGVLHRISLSLNRETDKHQVLKMVLKNAAELTLAGIGAMILIHDGKTELVSMFYAPWFDQRCEIPDDASRLHQRIAALLGDSERDVLRVTDLGGLSRSLKFPEGHPGLRGLLIGTLRDTRGVIMGHFMLSDKAGGEDFTVQDEEIIALLAAQSSVALMSAETFEREHFVAETLQSALLPQVPVREDMEVGLLYRSSGKFGRVGGDFYDFIELGENRIAIAVGDVCGKGLRAATYTAMIKYMLRAYLEEGLYPGDCLTRLNRSVHREISADKFVTMSLALIDTERQSITFSSAGHPPIMVCRHDEAAPLFARAAVPLGVIPDYKYLSSKELLESGCSVVMYTDGLIEARPEKMEPYGQDRLTSELAACNSLPAQGVADRLLGAAVNYSGESLRDDIALLVIRLAAGKPDQSIPSAPPELP
ncbi:MAG: SpoIIE family protein phosphatase [Thermoleophilia bacterium]|nr:SpoIIE family protein phosphatase [Thermoleophilia bacterium]